MNDPVVSARALVELGDLDGAERTLAAAALAGGNTSDRAARALLILCERRGEVGMRAQQALDEFRTRAPPGRENAAALARLARLYEELRVLPSGIAATTGTLPGLPDLPDLAGFGAKAAQPAARAAAGPAPVTLPAPPRTNSQPLAVSIEDLMGELSLELVVPTAPEALAMTVADPPSDKPSSGNSGRVRSNPSPRMTPGSGARSSVGAVPPDVARMLAPGAVISERYEVRSVLGRGGHATVLRVFDRELEEECALKVFHQSGDAADVARFKREVSLSRRIVHENVVKLYDLGQEGGHYYLTMEMLEGDDLSGVLKKRSITLREGMHWMIDACQGLQAAHDKGIVHRDVKPGNLFVQNVGPLKVMDFGIAKPADALTITMTGMFVGTPQFVSPEQAQGKEITPAADIYSLGIVMYLVFTGTVPFRDKEIVAVLMKHATERPEPPATRNPHLPDVIDALVVSCLEKKPKNRPDNCAEVAEVLEEVLRKLG